jgi:hypothetical protein
MQQEFLMLAQSNASNKLSKTLSKTPQRLDTIGTASIIDKTFHLFIEKHETITEGVHPSAAMLLDCLPIKAAKEGLKDTLVKMPLKEYMELRGLRDYKSTREQVLRDMDALGKVRFECIGTGATKGDWININLYGGTSGIKNGVIHYRFNQDFYGSFRCGSSKCLCMHFPKSAMQCNLNTNPHKYWLARKIAEHKRMNLGKPNENAISVSTLIDACPSFPSYEEVRHSNRHVTSRIINPFERDMNALNDVFSWEYKNDKPSGFKTLIENTAILHWNIYPETFIRKHSPLNLKKPAYTAESLALPLCAFN